MNTPADSVFLLKQPVICVKHPPLQKKKKSCIVFLLTPNRCYPGQKSTSKMCLQFIQSFTFKMCVPVAAFSPFYKATLVRLWLSGSENSGLYPTRGERKKKKTLEITMPCCCCGSTWTESSACLTTDALFQGQSTIIIL